ncbi:MAG: metallophosphoesterase family protein [Limnohabitans sp.]|jgi:predicted phosphodiesterase|nr:metallophosphoesterase family protein [Limnohabitans sp.]
MTPARASRGLNLASMETARTLVLSDLHLGKPGGARSALALRPLVERADRVIINGDAAELHHARFQQDAEAELAAFRDLCTGRGIRLDLIAGNHDAFVSETRSLTLADGAIYITHGDAFHPAIAPWSPYAASMRRTYEATLAALASTMPEDAARFQAAREASLAEWRSMGEGAHVSTAANTLLRPHRVLAVLAYWARFPSMASAWTDKFAPDAGTVLVGHSHRASVRTVGARRIVNTGSFGFPGKPHAVVIERTVQSTTVRVHRILEEGRHYTLDTSPRAAWRAERLQRPALANAHHHGAASTPAMNAAARVSASRSMDVE